MVLASILFEHVAKKKSNFRDDKQNHRQSQADLKSIFRNIFCKENLEVL